MKKLLVVMLVLGMASMASAELTLNAGSTEVAVDTSTTLSISGDGESPPMRYVIGLERYIIVDEEVVDTWGGETWATLDIENAVMHYLGSDAFFGMIADPEDPYYDSDTADAYADPWTNGVVGYDRDTLIMVGLGDLPTPPALPLPLGPDVDPLASLIGFTCKMLDKDVVVDLMDLDTAIVATVTITQTPEPMTIVLLGLGGLMLRRRR